MEVKNENTTPKTIPNDVDKEQKGINVPNLRFNQFHDSHWIKTSLKDVAKKINAKNKNKFCKNVISNSAQHGLIRQIDYFDKEIAQNESIENYTIINKGDFVYNPRKSIEAPYGPVNIYNYDEPGIVSPLYLCFSIQNINKNFLHYYFKSKAWHRFIYLYGDSGARHDRVSIKDEVFFSQQLSIPTSSDEIEKITDLLFQVEQRIGTQSKIIEDLESLKKSIINHYLYSNSSEKIMTLGEIINQVNNRNSKNNIQNVLSVNNKLGFIPQNEQFEDHEVASENKTNYKIITQYDFAYNPARINVGSIAMLSENDTGIISPMYICFNVNKNIILPSYLDIFIHSSKFLTEVNKRLEGSVRLCLSFEGLSSIQIPVPTLQKQYKIINDVTSLIKKINIETKLLQKLKEQKKYLLSNMFI